jgi:hypothetical protein
MSTDMQVAFSTDGATATAPNEPKPKPRSKPKGKATGESKGRRGINLSMSVEDYERFYIHALRLTGGNISELVCKLGREHLRDFHIAKTPTRTEG